MRANGRTTRQPRRCRLWTAAALATAIWACSGPAPTAPGADELAARGSAHAITLSSDSAPASTAASTESASRPVIRRPATSPEATDIDLVTRAQGGDERAFESGCVPSPLEK